MLRLCGTRQDGLPVESHVQRILEVKPIVNVGRHPSNDVVLGQVSTGHISLIISRKHAFFKKHTDGRIMMGTLASTNKTYVNGTRLPDSVVFFLRAGDIIHFGGPERVVRNEVTVVNPFKFQWEVNVQSPFVGRLTRRRAREEQPYFSICKIFSSLILQYSMSTTCIRRRRRRRRRGHRL
jgi:pSer/pThr/pTyr-binding forkhead associated (FHA) protein